jgi:hypothetical protein
MSPWRLLNSALEQAACRQTTCALRRARIKISALGAARCPRLADRKGIIVGSGRYHCTVRVIFDGSKSPMSLHQDYIELVSTDADQYESESPTHVGMWRKCRGRTSSALLEGGGRNTVERSKSTPGQDRPTIGTHHRQCEARRRGGLRACRRFVAGGINPSVFYPSVVLLSREIKCSQAAV